MIEEWRTHLQGVSHAHSVDFVQDIVRQEVFLVEPEIGGEIVSTRKTLAQLAEHAIERVRKGRAKERGFLRRGKRAIPVDVRLIWWKQAALEEAFDFVLQADFFVGNRPVVNGRQRKA